MIGFGSDAFVWEGIRCAGVAAVGEEEYGNRRTLL